ncbi:hypothetical protein QAD02_007653 [Eretmocerus hayati]|uniref:Uncharacterized protein n=1 Tax=Eretmocerus hayati TaxID=131215 RepID=A0ACC2N4I8_9HYME|nr:hypothetical protein QAD02_007653 [Eretmocerus hayati]
MASCHKEETGRAQNNRNQSRLERQHVDNAEEEEKRVKEGGKGQEKTKDEELLKLAIHKSSEAIRRKHRAFKQESLRDHEVKTEKSFEEPVDLDMTYDKYGDHTDDEEEEFKDAEIVSEEHIPVNYEDSNIIREIPRKSSLTGDHIGRSIRKKKGENRTSDTPHSVQESKKPRQDNNSFSGSFTEQGFLASKSNGTMESQTSTFQSNGEETSTSFTIADPIGIPKTGNTPDPTERACDEATHPQQKDEMKEQVSSTVVGEEQIYEKVEDAFRRILKTSLGDGSIGGESGQSLVDSFSEHYRRVSRDVNMTIKDKIHSSIEQVFAKITGKLTPEQNEIVTAVHEMVENSSKNISDEMNLEFEGNLTFHNQIKNELTVVKSDLEEQIDEINSKIYEQEEDRPTLKYKMGEFKKIFIDHERKSNKFKDEMLKVQAEVKLYKGLTNQTASLFSYHAENSKAKIASLEKLSDEQAKKIESLSVNNEKLRDEMDRSKNFIQTELRNYRLEIEDRFAKGQRDLQLRVVELEKLVTSNAGKNDMNWLDTNDHLAQFETQIKYASDRISSYRDDMDENHEEINERIDHVQTRIDRIEWDLNIVSDKVTHEPENNERILKHVEDTNKNVGMIAEQMRTLLQRSA